MQALVEKYTIAVIGGGNIGTQFACVCAAKGHKVKLYTSEPILYDGTLEIIDESGKVTIGKLDKVTADIGEALHKCQIVFVTHPAFRLKDVADQMLPYVTKSMKICMLPGTGGAEFAFSGCIKAGATLLGIQRVPTVARLEQKGKRVRCEGKRDALYIASIPKDAAKEFAGFLSHLFEIPCYALPNYLSVTLTPSNPILHTTRLRTMFSDYENGKVYERNPLFYGEWTDKSSELLLACDEELQNMLKLLDKLDLKQVKSLKSHYESNTIDEMTKKIRSIKSLHNLTSPMKQVENGWIPDFQSRYFTADFPFGLAIIEELASVLNFDAPHICDTMAWYRKVTGNMSHFRLSQYEIHKIEDIYTLY